MNREYRFSSLLTVAIAVCMIAVPECLFAQDDEPRLSNALSRKLQNEIIPALESENDYLFMQAVGPVIESGDLRLYEAIERFCQQNGLASVQEKYVDLKIQMVETGLADPRERIELSVAALIAQELTSRIRAINDRVSGTDIMQDPLVAPTNWRDGEDFFWDIHVAKNELVNAGRMLEYSVAVLMPHVRKVERSEDFDLIAIYQDVESLAVELPALHRDMIEREAECRLQRLALAHRTLTGTADFENLLLAAMALEIDGPLLEDFFESNNAGTIQRIPLQNTEAHLLEVRSKLETARESNETVIEKATLFRNGLHYWYRGRYGTGPLAYGLLKSPAAMNSTEAMAGLFMPRDPSYVIHEDYPGEEAYDPGYERRHYYTWAVEQRQFFSAYRSRDTTERQALSAEAERSEKQIERFY
ncbi:MAG: hypothetical protein AAF456_15940 [Planctomycetota bacterium]